MRRPFCFSKLKSKNFYIPLGAFTVYVILYAFRFDAFALCIPKFSKHSFARYFFSFLSSLGEMDKEAFFVLVFSILPVKFDKRREFIKSAFILFVVSTLIVFLMKPAIGRPRPKMLRSGIYAPRFFTLNSDYFSTPSGHTTVSFALSTFLSHHFSRYKILFFILAGLIGLSRIFLLYHYPSDVILSAALGYVIGDEVVVARK